MVDTGGDASRELGGRILASESLDGALYGVEQGQGIPQLVSRRCTLELMIRRSGRNRLRNERQNPRIATVKKGQAVVQADSARPVEGTVVLGSVRESYSSMRLGATRVGI